MSVIIAILISDTKCGIERNDFFIVLKAEVLGRELDSISGLVGVHIDLQALGSGVVGRLDLNGNELPVTLNDKINFSPTLGLPIVGVVAVNGKLHIDIVLRHTALEIVDFLDHIENIIGGQIFLGAKKPQIGYIDLERIDNAVFTFITSVNSLAHIL